MTPSKIIIEQRAKNLDKTQRFYSAIGMVWNDCHELVIGNSGLPVRIEEDPYLENFPHLWGMLCGVEFTFYLAKKSAPATSEANPATVFRVHYDDEAVVKSVIKRLQELHLLAYAKGFTPNENPCVLDPDGRQIQLCFPNPFMNAD